MDGVSGGAAPVPTVKMRLAGNAHGLDFASLGPSPTKQRFLHFGWHVEKLRRRQGNPTSFVGFFVESVHLRPIVGA